MLFGSARTSRPTWHQFFPTVHFAHPFPHRSMGCCSSTANGPEVSPEATNVADSVPVPVPIIAAPPLEQPSTTLSRPRSRTQSTHRTARQSTERIEMIPRNRAQSAPHRAQPMVSSSSQHSQDPRIRANTLVGSATGSRSSPRPPVPGERGHWLS